RASLQHDSRCVDDPRLSRCTHRGAGIARRVIRIERALQVALRSSAYSGVTLAGAPNRTDSHTGAPFECLLHVSFSRTHEATGISDRANHTCPFAPASESEGHRTGMAHRRFVCGAP